MPRLGFMTRLGAVLLVVCSRLAAAAPSYNLERDLETPGTRAVAFFRTDPLLGVPDADSSAPEAGIVRHFARADGALLRTLESPAPAPGDRFGFSIAVAGPLIFVGAPGDDAVGVDSGAVFVFDGATGAHVRTLHAPSPTPNAQFGFSVAARRDDVIVGAPFAGGTQPDAGAAYLFAGASGDLLLTFTNDGAGGDQFGAAVARAGNDVLVGAPLDGGTGAAFLFDGATGERRNAFRGPQAAEGDLFGASVAPIGDDVIIGAPFAEGAGAVYRFNRTGDTPNKTYLPPDGATAFGTALATVGRDFAVSAPGGELEQNPAALVVDGVTGNVIQTLFPLVPIPFRDRFEPPLAASGRDVLVEDALFEFCGRACEEGCGNGIVETDLGETCDAGDPTNSFCPDCVRGEGSTSTTSTTSTTSLPMPTTSSTSSTSSTSATTSPTTNTSITSTTTSPPPSTSTTSTTTSPPSSTSTTSTTTSPSTAPVPSTTSTSTSPAPSVTSSTAPQSIPGAICTRDADCAGPLCEGASRCVQGRCQIGQAPGCFDAATCVLAAGLPSTSCAEAPARVARFFERSYVLVLGAQAVAPDSLQRAKRRLGAAARQLTRARKLVGQLADKGKLPPSCADTLAATIARALERTNSFRNNLAACAS